MNNGNNNTSNSSPLASAAVYTILALLVVILIGYIVWKAMKKKIIKKKELKFQLKKNNETKELFYDYVVSFYEIIQFAKKELSEFKPSLSEKTMGQIKNGAAKLTLKLLQREDFSKSFLENSEYDEFVKHSEMIAGIGCNLWENKAKESLDFFEKQYSQIPDSEHKTTYQELVKKSIKDQYYKEDK